MAVSLTRRLPGIRFEALPPPSAAGAAADGRGRLRRLRRARAARPAGPGRGPGAVRGDLRRRGRPLAWDAVLEQDARSQLGPAVRAFFANGGRRCYRRARRRRGAETSAFVLPGLLARDGRRSFRRAELPARSPGSFADAVAVGTALTCVPLGIARGSLRTLEFDLAPPAPGAVAAGDLLRLEGAGFVVFVAVRSVAPHGGRGLVRVRGDRGSVVWVDEEPFAAPASGTADVIGLDLAERESVPVTVRVSETPGRFELDLDAADRRGAGARRDGARPRRRPEPARARRRGGAAARARRRRHAAPGRRDRARRLVRLRGAVPRAMRDADPTLARSSRGISGRGAAARAATDVRRLGGLGFARRPPALARAAALRRAALRPRHAGPGRRRRRSGATRRLRASRSPATARTPARRFFPLGMDVLPRLFAPPRPSARTALARDGLALFDDSLFLDRALAPTPAARRWPRRPTRSAGSAPSRGCCAGCTGSSTVEEVTLVAVPDAAQRPWSWTPRPELPPATADPRREHPPSTASTTAGCACSPRRRSRLRRPTSRDGLSSRGRRPTRMRRSSSRSRPIPASPTRPRSTAARRGSSSCTGAVPPTTACTPRTRPARATGRTPSPPTPRRAAGSCWTPPDAYSPANLLAVHRALLRACAARGDVVATLALPAHLREDGAAAHAASLALRRRRRPTGRRSCRRSTRARRARSASARSSTRGSSAATALASRRPTAPRPACSRAGRRARRLGRAANEPLRDVVALAPPAAARRAAGGCRTRSVNVVRQEPRGFLLLAADTLAPTTTCARSTCAACSACCGGWRSLHGPTLRLRAERRPASAAPSSAASRSCSARCSERGAFAGATPRPGVPGRDRRPAEHRPERRRGPLIVELRVAPSRPLVVPHRPPRADAATAGCVAEGRVDGARRRRDRHAALHGVQLRRRDRRAGRLDAVCNAAFAECDGLEMTIDVKTIREGGNNGAPDPARGRRSAYGTLTLKRGMTASFDLWDWFDASCGDPSLRGDGEVVLFARRRQTRARALRADALPAGEAQGAAAQRQGRHGRDRGAAARLRVAAAACRRGARVPDPPRLAKAELRELDATSQNVDQRDAAGRRCSSTPRR